MLLLYLYDIIVTNEVISIHGRCTTPVFIYQMLTKKREHECIIVDGAHPLHVTFRCIQVNNDRFIISFWRVERTYGPLNV